MAEEHFTSTAKSSEEMKKSGCPFKFTRPRTRWNCVVCQHAYNNKFLIGPTHYPPKTLLANDNSLLFREYVYSNLMLFPAGLALKFSIQSKGAHCVCTVEKDIFLK